MGAEIIRDRDNRYVWRIKSGRKFALFPENRLSPLTRELSDDEASNYREAVQAALGKLFDEQQRIGKA